MADMVASPLLRMLSERLSSLTDNSFAVKNLRLTLAEIQTLVLESENRSEEDEAYRRWLTEVKDAAYEADDVLDEFNHLSNSKVSKLFLFLYQWLIRSNLQRKMKDIEARLDALLKRRMKFQKAVPLVTREAVYFSFENNPSIKVPHRETRSFVSESQIFGRTEDKKILMDLLLSDNNDSQFKIIPVVGMGGLGKTTLAQLIYNDEMVNNVFEKRYWVSVSQNFDVRMIGKALVETETEASRFLMNTEETVDAIVRGKLRRRRFFIVLDDVWNEDQEKWNVLQSWFRMGARGSAVLVTTRSANVAALMGTVEPYSLKPLSDVDGWLLFKHVAFSSKDEDNFIRLAEIGKRLVVRCEGLPLAIKTLAGLMRFKTEESEWLQIKDDDIWNLPEFESSVLPALRLSYNHLPSHLKQCFAYCSIFPQGVTIYKEQLIELWIAEGFIQSSEGSRNLEDIGNDYFMELFRRSFFVEIRRNEDGEIVNCQMHYLIHDLARFVASIGCSIMEGNALQTFSEEVRHSSLVYDSDKQSTALELLQKAKKLRTLLLFSSNLEKIPGLFLKLRSLRALDLSGSGILKVSKSVAKLRHLRYLNLSGTPIETLPDSISKLQSLNTLELIKCYNLLELPNSISELTNLRYLDIQSCCSLSHMPSKIGNLGLLQKLPLFILSNIDGSAYISELGELDLRGELEIKNLECVGSPLDAESAKLLNKLNLRSLKLSWSHDVSLSAEVAIEVLEKLMPPQQLKVLHIIDYKGSSYPSWMMNSFLQNIVKFSLINCSCQKLPPLGQLPNLKDLYIQAILGVEIIDYEFYGGDGYVKGFPSLRRLELYDMPSLKEWWSFKLDDQLSVTKIGGPSSSCNQIKAFPCLEFLTIKGCSNLTRLPELPNLKILALWNCNNELLLSLDRLTSMSTLVINEFPKPLFVPSVNLTSLKKMTIYDCDDPLTQLKDGMERLSSLEHLRILYCNALTSLPTSLGHLTSLQKLEIAECQELACVPDVMENLYSLKEFIIDGCPMLKSLPNSIRFLTKLEKLVIRRCPELNMQLDIENSEEWSKTAHIPCIVKEIEEYLTEEDSAAEP